MENWIGLDPARPRAALGRWSETNAPGRDGRDEPGRLVLLLLLILLLPCGGGGDGGGCGGRHGIASRLSCLRMIGWAGCGVAL